MKPLQKYGAVALVFVASVALAFFLPTTEALKGISALPAVGALFYALWQMFRDDVAHRRQLELESQKQFFNLTVTSHMATVAFDKHVAFCEEYVARVHEGMLQLWREGPNPKAADFGRDLTTVRVRHAPWVSDTITKILEKYEKALVQLGVAAAMLREPDLEDRQMYISKAWSSFMNVAGLASEAEKPDPEIAYDRTISHLQKVLGIAELTELRQAIIEKASQTKL